MDDLSGSSASVLLRMANVHVLGAGTGKSDQDGVRVDERGEGGITFLSSGSTYEASGADGVELDEGGSGDVILDIVNSDFPHNGPLDPQDLDEESTSTRPTPALCEPGSPSPGFDHNYDDAIDLNELGPGDVTVVIAGGTVTGTVDETACRSMRRGLATST